MTAASQFGGLLAGGFGLAFPPLQVFRNRCGNVASPTPWSPRVWPGMGAENHHPGCICLPRRRPYDYCEPRLRKMLPGGVALWRPGGVSMPSDRWVVGITGASGTVYARRLIRAVVERLPEVALDVIVTPAAIRVMHDEEGLVLTGSRLTVESLTGMSGNAFRDQPRVAIHSPRNIGAGAASGSYRAAGMVIVPCSMKTLAAIAHGYADNLLTRAADVTLKEGRKLVIVPRETPLSAIHLENMLRLARFGAAIVPAMPGFYHRPATVADIVDMMVMRILDQMGYRLDLTERWPRSSASRRDEPIAEVSRA